MKIKGNEDKFVLSKHNFLQIEDLNSKITAKLFDPSLTTITCL